MRLSDKVALVVGGGQTPGQTLGNGRAIALTFAQEGARVVVADRDPASAEETAAAIAQAGGHAQVAQVDVRDDHQCRQAVNQALTHYGQLDIVVNNVGVGSGDAGLSRLTDDAWDDIFAVNVKGALHICRHAIPHMRERQCGVVLNISSVASVCAAPYLAYKSSKAALNALTHALAMSNAKHGVRVNAILPGLMNTPMAIEGLAAAGKVDRETLIEERNRRVPLRGGMGSAWDVAHAACFLASAEAAFITGVLLPVDGGQSARIG